MTELLREARKLGIPAILIASAVADNCLDELVGSCQVEFEESPPPEVETREKQPADNALSICLTDRNGVFVRRVSRREATYMVKSGHAEAVMPGGWRNRRDVAWTAVRLTQVPEITWSTAAISDKEMELVAGALGRGDEESRARAARAKFRAWPFVHDDRAVLVVPRA